MTEVLIVDDQRIPREYMEHIVTESGRYSVAGSISAAELAEAVCTRRKVDLVLMDVCTNGVKDGITAARELREKFPGLKIIIVTSMAEESYLKRAREALADSFWYKDASPESLLEVMDRTMSGESVFPGATPTVRLGNTTSADLTPKEIEILRMVCDALENTEIAKKLGCSVNTVKTHIAHILRKTGYANKTRLAIAVTNKRFIIPAIPDKDKPDGR